MDVDWDLCFICQETCREKLKSPANDPRGGAQQCFAAFLENINTLRSIGYDIPSSISHQTSAEFLLQHEAKWHKNCYSLYNKQKVDRALKRKNDGDKVDARDNHKRRRTDAESCLFCTNSEGHLNHCSTMNIDAKIKAMARELQDSAILSKLEGGSDVIALEIKYHLSCYLAYGNKYRSFVRDQDETKIIRSKNIIHRVFEEVMSDITEKVIEGTFVFALNDLFEIYTNRLKAYDFDIAFNKTYFKQDILSYFGKDLHEQKVGRNIKLVFSEGLQQLLKDHSDDLDHSEEAKILAKAAKIIRSDILDHKPAKFSGHFERNCQDAATPSKLKSLIAMIVYGNSTNTSTVPTQEVLTVCQLLYSHCRVKSNVDQRKVHVIRETPLLVYLSSKIHLTTRNKQLIEVIYKLGLGIRYKRQLQIEDQMASSQCNHYEKEGLVVPSNLKSDSFTVGVVDNIDHNPTSTSSKNSFHGTAISIFQVTTEKSTDRVWPDFPPLNKNDKLPSSYTTVPEFSIQKSSVECKISNESTRCPEQVEAINEEKWLEHSCEKIQGTLGKDDSISWSGYHATEEITTRALDTIDAILPVFYEKSSSPAMMKHSVDVIANITECLNTGQIPVVVADQPLYAELKYLQWALPDRYGDGKLVVLMGGLHIEMSLWNCIGDILENSGWTTVLVEAEVSSPGGGNLLLKSHHLTKTRAAHEVTLLALHKLKIDAYTASCTSLTFDEWKQQMSERSATFAYWDLIMQLQAKVFSFVRAQRSMDFSLYIQTLDELAFLYFSLNHHNYARWLSVHIADLKVIPEAIYEEFMMGNFVTNKTKKRFSAMAFDQRHEQNNKILKDQGGIIGMTEDPALLQKWLVCGPQLTRLVTSFEEAHIEEDISHNSHHSQSYAFQQKFQVKVRNLVQTIDNYGNPFSGDIPELINIASRACFDEDVEQNMRSLKMKGDEQYEKFRTEVLHQQSVSIHTPIKRNALTLMKTTKNVTTNQADKKAKSLRNNVALFGKLFLILQSRKCDLMDLFRHEIQGYPPSLSNYGEINLPNKKSDVLDCIAPSTFESDGNAIDCKILDGPALVHIWHPKAAKNFAEYANDVFIANIRSLLANCHRVDVVFDRYVKDSLKTATRDKRGKGTRRKVCAETKIPGCWSEFLKDNKNKVELFHFLAENIVRSDFPENKIVYVTYEEEVWTKDAIQMDNCSHEEADTRMVVHAKHALTHGMKNVEIRTVDSDVVVIFVANFSKLHEEMDVNDIIVLFGAGKHLRRYSVKDIYNSLGQEKAKGLAFWVAFTGCDDMSSFRSKGKKTAWKTWLSYPDITATFADICSRPFVNIDESSETFARLQRFVVLLYSPNSAVKEVDESRMDLFCHRNQDMELLPPTKNSLLQHANRAVYRSSVWMSADQAMPISRSPSDFSWNWRDGQWQPLWFTIPEASESCRKLLIHCACKAECSRCRCSAANMKCTPLCKCRC